MKEQGEVALGKKIYLLRHGQTQFNVEQRLQGHCNSALTALGVAQAKAMGQSLKARIEPQQWQVVCSPLSRARRTAELVSDELGLPYDAIIEDERLQEAFLGDWEQLVAPEVKAQHPYLKTMPDWYLQGPNAESYEHIRQRLSQWLAEPTLPEQLIVVSHGLTGTVLRGVLTDMTYQQVWAQDRPQDAYFYIENGVIERIECSVQ